MILPSFDGSGGGGLVPLWLVERERLAQEEKEKAEKAAREELEAKRAAEETAAAEAAAAAAAAAAEAARLEAEAEAARQAAEAAAAADSAARAFAEQGLVKVDDDAGQIGMHDPAQALLDSLGRAAFFRELLPHNAWQYVQQGRPFAILILCRCAQDDSLDIGTLENLLMDRGLHHRFSLLWVRSPTRDQFRVGHTYGLAEGDLPAFVIDNVPIGQHVEKYLFPGRLARPHTASPVDVANFLSDFLLAPTPLGLIQRTQPAPAPVPGTQQQGRGEVVEVVGSTFEELVLRAQGPVLLVLVSPTCPACLSAAPVFDEVAKRMAWTHPDVLVARLDRTENDLPLVLRFASYPAVFLYPSGSKRAAYAPVEDDDDAAAAAASAASAAAESEQEQEQPQNRGKHSSRGWMRPVDFFEDHPRQEGTCNAPLSVADLEEFVRRHTGRGGNLLGAAGDEALSPQQQPQSEMMQSTPQDAPDQQQQQQQQPAAQAEQPAQQTQSTQQAGAAM